MKPHTFATVKLIRKKEHKKRENYHDLESRHWHIDMGNRHPFGTSTDGKDRYLAYEKESWKTSNIFASLDLRSNDLQPTRFCYPSVFEVEEVLRTWSCEDEHSYDYTGKEVAVSFRQTDSIYVSSDFQNAKGYFAKSRHAPNMRPKLYNAQIDNKDRLRKAAMEYDYWHLMYDKYRKVFYRFVRHPYEFPPERNAMIDEDRGRVFSIVILNDKYEIIGETTFPGHTYHYKQCFVGKKGLYISLNNQDNPIFSEDELFFQCLELKDH